MVQIIPSKITLDIMQDTDFISHMVQIILMGFENLLSVD